LEDKKLIFNQNEIFGADQSKRRIVKCKLIQETTKVKIMRSKKASKVNFW